MAEIIFYEKPGCINNNKQKKLLIRSGHWVQAVDIFNYKWTEERLLSFFSKLPVAQWFNQSAPQIKAGKIDPEQCDHTTALALMVKDPIYIRRPLMQVGERKMVGFDQQQVDNWIGLAQPRNYADIESCPISA